jgi:hypothetical protein
LYATPSSQNDKAVIQVNVISNIDFNRRLKFLLCELLVKGAGNHSCQGFMKFNFWGRKVMG